MQIDLLNGDCLKRLSGLQENSVDSIVTDPPYELGFMGKGWDKTGIANNVELWSECLRVLKPGGHLLAFSGTRTYHRMASAIEDAGFEVRDMIEWVYGSGFPKSLNIGKAVDKLQGNEREVTGKSPHFDKYNSDKYVKNNAVEYVGRKTKEEVGYLTKGTSEWEGWGTALKPAHEPICMARKPLSEKTVAENCLKWGTGGINIDESRVGDTVETWPKSRSFQSGISSGYTEGVEKTATQLTGDAPNGRFPANLILSADEDGQVSEEVRECFPETNSKWGKSSGVDVDPDQCSSFKIGLDGQGIKERTNKFTGDSGNTSRFFKSINISGVGEIEDTTVGEDYRASQKAGTPQRLEATDGASPSLPTNFKSIIYQAKASKKDRGVGNNHPTVKSVALMEYLIKMVTPKGGTVLDPFMGSGSTGVAAKRSGYGFIGIELDKDYFEIASHRIA